MLFCQDKEIGVGAMERKRIEYIDWLRIISAIAVITLLVDSISVTDAVRQPNLKGHSVIPKNVNAFWRDFQKKGMA